MIHRLLHESVFLVVSGYIKQRNQDRLNGKKKYWFQSENFSKGEDVEEQGGGTVKL